MATDPFAKLTRQRHREQAELERLLDAVGQAALADTLTGMWANVLGTRPVLIAASQPPNSSGLELVAKRLWEAALETWFRPVVESAWVRRVGDTSYERTWDRIVTRMSWTVDLVVKAVTSALKLVSKESADQQRSAIAEVLSLDAVSFTLWEQIHETQLSLLNPDQPRSNRDAAYARRVRLQTNNFALAASRARSKGFAALAAADPDNGDDWRNLAREASRSAADVRKAERELLRLDEKLFYNPNLDPEKLTRLTAKLHKLNGTDSYGHESWRNSITRDARAVATGLLNAAHLQHGIQQSHATGAEWVKRWSAINDTRTRPTHRAADGQVRPILDEFDIGDAKLDHPADFDAPADEFWNCRCAMLVLSKTDHDAIADVLTAAMEEVPMTVPAIEEGLSDLPPLMWHGVIILEDTYTGDRRFFRDGAIRTQAMPLPIRFQREDWGGHQGAVVVANAEAARRYGKAIRAWGTFADGALTPEVEEVVGLMASGMIRGISIDGDDVLDSQFTLELDDEANAYEMYDSMRLRGATMCAIPAFDGAEVWIGPPPPEWLLEGEPIAVEQNAPGRTRPLDDISDEELEAMLAASRVPENLAEYWTGPEGSARVGGWGTPGSYTRCLSQLAEYVAPGQVAGTCANLYHRATGEWPGRQKESLRASVLSDGSRAGEASGLQEHELTTDADWLMTAEQFAPRELGELTPVTIDDDGNVYGHIAGWQTCHAGFSDMCVTPPKSRTGYALFHTGAVRLDDGTDLPVGKLTVGAGHANPNGLGVRGATAHYDNSAVAVAVVRATEDKYGIQVSGRVIPGTPRERVEELRRSPISGDWRAYQGNLELVAGLGVNSPGFPVPRTMVASLEGRQLSLVAAGYVPSREETQAAESAADEFETLAMRMHAPLIAAMTARMEPTQAELDARAAKLAERMATLNGGQ